MRGHVPLGRAWQGNVRDSDDDDGDVDGDDKENENKYYFIVQVREQADESVFGCLWAECGFECPSSAEMVIAVLFVKRAFQLSIIKSFIINCVMVTRKIQSRTTLICT